MNIDKAIEVLTLENKHPWNNDNSDLRNAVKLGIEALKRIEHLRPNYAYANATRLPGETKD